MSRLAKAFDVFFEWWTCADTNDVFIPFCFAVIFSGAGMVQLLFASPLTCSLLRNWKDRKTGVIIDDSGITDNTILFSAGNIPWSDIQEIKQTKDKLLIILVITPTTYISRQPNYVKRRFMTKLLQTHGSPIILASNELKSDFVELQNLLQTERKAHKRSQGEYQRGKCTKPCVGPLRLTKRR